MFRNYKAIGRILYGRNSFDQLDDLLGELRVEKNSYVLFLLDVYFEGKEFMKRVPLHAQDILKIIEVKDEPKTKIVDAIVAEVKSLNKGLPVSVVGIGGGSVMDYAKAIRLMFTNEGSSALYQGIDLIRNKGVHCTVIPTISGTGAEVSMTTVLTGPEKKLGIKGNFTPADQLVIDPALIASVPEPHRFYTAMDCYIHNIEALNGHRKTVMGDSLGTESLRLCREIFLSEDSHTPENDEKLMIASYLGGLSLTYSEVGACHAISYGLATVTGIHHGVGNCIVFNQLEEFYPEAVKEFRAMMKNNNIDLPKGFNANRSSEEIEKMIDVSLTLIFMWAHVCGPDWQKIITREKLRGLLLKM
ncbi:MAG: iron-containing alcohol dehydrogenase family protein [Bacteroidetes bacterium]|nr:iron-containing alcohol dehydrogenase family protein [Bacteroidota bacterium]MCL6101082.1 iron-containing alcohol dehydrogenase family protein [Bacteroidota bacterium]